MIAKHANTLWIFILCRFYSTLTAPTNVNNLTTRDTALEVRVTSVKSNINSQRTLNSLLQMYAFRTLSTNTLDANPNVHIATINSLAIDPLYNFANTGTEYSSTITTSGNTSGATQSIGVTDGVGVDTVGNSNTDSMGGSAYTTI